MTDSPDPKMESDEPKMESDEALYDKIYECLDRAGLKAGRRVTDNKLDDAACHLFELLENVWGEAFHIGAFEARLEDSYEEETS